MLRWCAGCKRHCNRCTFSRPGCGLESSDRPRWSWAGFMRLLSHWKWKNSLLCVAHCSIALYTSPPPAPSPCGPSNKRPCHSGHLLHAFEIYFNFNTGWEFLLSVRKLKEVLTKLVCPFLVHACNLSWVLCVANESSFTLCFMFVGSRIESGFFSTRTPLSLPSQKDLTKWKSTKRRIHIMTKVKCFRATWLTCNLVTIALVQRRSPLEEGCSLRT